MTTPVRSITALIAVLFAAVTISAAAALAPTGATTSAPPDISGPCDEAEHRSDPRCAATPPPAPAPVPTPAPAPAPVPAPVDVSGPCDEAEHIGDPRCATSTPAPVVTVPSPTTTAPAAPAPAPPTTSTTTTVAPAPSTIPATEATVATDGGTVSYRYDGSFTLTAATPADGWSMKIEQSGGIEVDVTFERGSVRIDVDIEIDDGAIRERVRTRDDADDSEIRVENGVVTRVEPGKAG